MSMNLQKTGIGHEKSRLRVLGKPTSKRKNTMNITELTNTLTTMQNNLTPSELERLAYISGDTVRANVLALLDDAQLTIEALEDQVCNLESKLSELE